MEDCLKRARFRNLFAWCFVAASLLCACKRAEGESCQDNTDCDDGLVCCIAESAARGTCAATLDECTQTNESGSDDDAGPSE